MIHVKRQPVHDPPFREHGYLPGIHTIDVRAVEPWLADRSLAPRDELEHMPPLHRRPATVIHDSLAPQVKVLGLGGVHEKKVILLARDLELAGMMAGPG